GASVVSARRGLTWEPGVPPCRKRRGSLAAPSRRSDLLARSSGGPKLRSVRSELVALDVVVVLAELSELPELILAAQLSELLGLAELVALDVVVLAELSELP